MKSQINLLFRFYLVRGFIMWKECSHQILDISQELSGQFHGVFKKNKWEKILHRRILSVSNVCTGNLNVNTTALQFIDTSSVHSLDKVQTGYTFLFLNDAYSI